MNLENTTILAVDDNPTNLEALFDFLTRYGCTVLLKTDGAKALALAQRRKPDLILLDIVMPGLDGFETCQRLKADEATKMIPVIFMSALTDTVDKVKGFGVGAVDYITKPFQYEEVLARVNAHVTIQRLQQDLQTKNVTLQDLLEREHRLLDELRLHLSLTLPHELRTPLNIISGFAQLLKSPSFATTPDQVMEYAQHIYSNSLRLQRLMENTLLYAHLKLLKYTSREGGNWPVQENLSTQRFIQAVAKQQAQTMSREADLRLELVDTHLRIAPNNLKKILTELLSNAFKFSAPGTPVTITTTINGHLCILSIRDQGRGMTQEQIENIGAYMQFERREYEQQGVGLGLIIAYLLMQLEGGVLSIDSQVGQGTTISLVLNCAPERPGIQLQPSRMWFADSVRARNNGAAAGRQVTGYRLRQRPALPDFPQPVTPQTIQAAAQPLTILVIDANQENLAELKQILAPSGVQVLAAIDSDEGLNLVFDYHPALILIDLQTLENEDFELNHQLRQMAAAPPIKILTVTDTLLASEQRQKLLAFCDEILPLPLQPQMILDAMQQHLGLEWILQPEISPAMDTCQDGDWFALPSGEVLQQLNRSAQAANITMLEEQIATLRRNDPGLNPFAERILALSKQFQFEQIQRILEACLSRKTDSTEGKHE